LVSHGPLWAWQGTAAAHQASKLAAQIEYKKVLMFVFIF
jgi:hypothetical protein